MKPLIVVLSGLAGAAGVATYAAAAHSAGPDDPARVALSNAAVMLMVHAAAAIAIDATALAPDRWLTRALRLSALAMVVGAILFGGAVAAPKLLGVPLFPMAAPIGGSLTIASWVAVAVLGLWASSTSRQS